MSALIAYLVSAGLPLVTLVVAAEAVGAPLPGESLIIALGAALGARHESIAAAFFALWLGAVLGDSLGYVLGRRLGRTVLLRHGGRIGLTEARFHHAEALFARWGMAVVVVARFFVFLRQLNGVLAGSLGLPWWRFVLANTLGGALWVGFWLTVSDRLSGRVLTLVHHLPHLKLVVFVALAASIVVVLVRHLRRPRAPGQWW